MLKYSKGQKISLNLILINNDGSPEEDATVYYKIYNETNTLELSGSSLTFNEQLGSYIDIINPLTEWLTQDEGIYYIKWEISGTTEDYPNKAVEELYIEKYDEKLNRVLGLLHENVFIDNAVYDKWDNLVSARMRIYSNSSSVGTDNNIIGEYEITAESQNVGKFNIWQQKRIN